MPSDHLLMNLEPDLVSIGTCGLCWANCCQKTDKCSIRAHVPKSLHSFQHPESIIDPPLPKHQQHAGQFNCWQHYCVWLLDIEIYRPMGRSGRLAVVIPLRRSNTASIVQSYPHVHQSMLTITSVHGCFAASKIQCWHTHKKTHFYVEVYRICGNLRQKGTTQVRMEAYSCI